ncbi:MAG: Panacea domain-containing protein [Nostoc sp. DedQUE04]|uniref:Panacea domain-containing protein n=1 Tax=Nostoc sp. DedQUE04 TaxID=3075390 RepID=UPI002AD52589|nr:Panacea domain-containing protein [Nostoc sp. DedQUE04]MDZ8138842.1 Panacea domain-containing protein [Nostoc sp. DedQUE04]
MEIRFKFHPEKAVEVACLFLKLHGKPMSYLGLLKLLYMADRIALERLEQPITGDRYVSMNYGPVLSRVYDLIKGLDVPGAKDLWSRYISSRDPRYKIYADYTVSLREYPGDDELSEAEVKIIEQVYAKYGHIDPFDLAETTHLFPEWVNPYGSAIPISVEEVLKNVGKTDEDIERIREEFEREDYLDWVLNG